MATTTTTTARDSPVLRLPHPYLTSYYLVKSSKKSSSESNNGATFFQLETRNPEANSKPLREPLHSASLYFTELADLKSSERPPESNNTPWGRSRRAPSSTFAWEGREAPTLGQAWLLIHVLFTLRPSTEVFRLTLEGAGKDQLAHQLKAVALAVDHPVATGLVDELVVLRSTFWQGAGSPFGPRSAWLPEDSSSPDFSTSAYPITPLQHTMTNDPGVALTWHPRRPVKPRPGSTVYSRWIPHLGEHFSMVALDYTDAEHLRLFHEWQNDPRVSQGWNETGTLEQHREYLRRQHVDPHQITLLAKFDDTFFAYFEVYWGKEDRLGAYYSAGDFDRGRHSLVGDVRFRGPHRVSAWWSSLMHYLFLDDPRTMHLIGEPKYTNSSVLSYDFIHGFGLDKFVDLPHKRSAFMRCSRERFFQLAPLGGGGDAGEGGGEKVVGGTLVGLVPKL
ncbi:aerobactin siderophore biosynthesis protein iucB [Apiospora arundinis]|uniref:Acyl-CoA N-acyltransferase n=1 Tax=Apiospora arundinis TaxID=335852 RepID=A0ABR2HLU1_9PEZI